VIESRRYKAIWVSNNDEEWSAQLSLPNTNVLLRGRGPEGQVELELWDAEPVASRGIAVVNGSDGHLGLASIPLCSCGEKDCGHVHRQYRIRAGHAVILETLEVLESLDRLNVDPYNSRLWLDPLKAGDETA
jgi:hypothetical protein